MKEYEFMSRSVLKERDIQNYVKEKYDVLIDENSLMGEDGYENLDKIFTSAVNAEGLRDFAEKLDGNVELDMVTKNYLRRIWDSSCQILCDISEYSMDLMADVYMGLLQADEKNDVKFSEQFKSIWENDDSINKSTDMENIRKHYPYASKRNISEEGIPGRCYKYHEVMIRQKNIVVFELRENLKSLKRYAFPKTYEIYHELEKTPVENLLLLEKTQGIGYTNQMYSLVKKRMLKGNLGAINFLLMLIKRGIKVSPIFLRTKILGILLNFKGEEFQQINSDQVKMELYNMVESINRVYEQVLEFTWYLYWLAYKRGMAEVLSSDNKRDLRKYLLLHFDMDRAWADWAETEKFYNWRNIDEVTDCFEKFAEDINEYDEELGAQLEKKKENWKDKWETESKERYKYSPGTKEEVVNFITANGKYWMVLVKKYKNELGKTIRDKVMEEMYKENTLPDDEKEILRIYYEKVTEVFEEIKKEEKKDMEEMDPRENKVLKIWKDLRKLYERKEQMGRLEEKEITKIESLEKELVEIKPLYVYAIIHAEVVRELNIEL